MVYELQFTEHSLKEERSLDGNERVFVDKAFQRIKERGMEAGQPLKGDLKNCRKLKNKKHGLRIVFCQIDNKIEIIEIAAMGKRSNSEVYNNAIKRLKI